MSKFLVVIFLIFYLSPFSFAQKAGGDKTDAPKEISKSNKNIKYGIASFYADKFKGRHTANGEIYNPDKLTAACNILPLNTWIKVTNLKNKKSVIVKINDRLHYKNKRLVDLSKSAAKKLGYTAHGLAKVKVEVLKVHP